MRVTGARLNCVVLGFWVFDTGLGRRFRVNPLRAGHAAGSWHWRCADGGGNTAHGIGFCGRD